MERITRGERRMSLILNQWEPAATGIDANMGIEQNYFNDILARQKMSPEVAGGYFIFDMQDKIPDSMSIAAISGMVRAQHPDQAGEASAMEKRSNTRVLFHVRSVLKYGDKIIEGEVENLSTGGMLFRTAAKIPAHESVDITIYLYGSSSNLTLNISGRVKRTTGRGIAIKFTELDLDSFVHLRNIVSRNDLGEKASMKEYRTADTEGGDEE
jgi:hypothetical protein